jgi:BirA family biotin operon repressor/biotin-[acetyl-CoA-carboxylase] ligase
LLATEQFYLSMAISLGICSIVNRQCSIGNKSEISTIDHQPLAKIKWPNDIYVADKKIAGMLIENTIAGMHLRYSIVGIGLNVNQENFPSNTNATSIKNITGKNVGRNEILNTLLVAIEKYFLLLKGRKFEQLKKEYLNNLYRYNTKSSYKKEDIVFEGKIIDVDETGYLFIETKNAIEKFGFKEVSFVI